MGFFDRLFGRKGDPTTDWAAPEGLPTLDTGSASLGGVAFGTPLEQASRLGKPSEFLRHDQDHLELVYAGLGLRLEFDAQGLNYVAWHVDHDPADQVRPGMSFSSPVVLSANESHEFSRSTKRPDLEAALGAPASVDEDHDEIILHYERGALHLEFELHPRTGNLKRLNAFPL